MMNLCSRIRSWLDTQANIAIDEGNLEQNADEIIQNGPLPAESGVVITAYEEDLFISYETLEIIKNIVADFLFYGCIVSGGWGGIDLLVSSVKEQDTEVAADIALMVVSIFGICFSRYMKNHSCINEQ